MKNNTFLSFIAFLLLVSVLFIGCDDNNDGNKSPTAVLSATESTLVPGRIVLDASQSFDRDGNIISYTFRIDELNGDTVAGPVTSFDVPEGSVDSVILPKGDYIAFLTVADNNGATDMAETAISHDSDVVFSTTSTSTSTLKALPGVQARTFESSDITCSKSPSGPPILTCVLGSGTNTVDINDVVSLIGLLPCPNCEIPDAMWIQAWGAKGGNGDSIGAGCSIISGCAGPGGLGGFAQTITTIGNFQDSTVGFGTSRIFYYLGKAGTHSDDVGGQGGTSTLVTFQNIEFDNFETDELNLGNDVLLIAGGGGGGGTSNNFFDGTSGTRGGLLLAFGGFPGAGAGGNSNKCTGGSDSGAGDGGVAGNGLSTSGTFGIGGKGGTSEGCAVLDTDCSFINNTWLNGFPNVDGRGQGGNGDSRGGGGGGGYGGGGGEGPNGGHPCGSIDGGCTGFGGCGGGSYANSKDPNVVDTFAPTGFVANTDTADGEVRIVFQ